MSDFVPGLEGVVAFETEIAEPDKEGGALRYRGVDIEDLVGHVSFGNVWGLLVDGSFNPGLPPAEPFPIPVHSGDIRVDVQSALAMLAPSGDSSPSSTSTSARRARTWRGPRSWPCRTSPSPRAGRAWRWCRSGDRQGQVGGGAVHDPLAREPDPGMSRRSTRTGRRPRSTA